MSLHRFVLAISNLRDILIAWEGVQMSFTLDSFYNYPYPMII